MRLSALPGSFDMEMQSFYQELDAAAALGDAGALEKFLARSLTDADRRKAYDEYAAIAEEMVRFYQLTGRYDKAEAASNDLLLLLEELQMEDSAYFAAVLMNHANGYRDSGRADDAEEFYERSLRTLAVAEDATPALSGAVWSNRAVACLMSARPREAERAFRETVRICEEAGLTGDPHYISALAGIGESLAMQGDYPDSLAAYERAKEEVRFQDGEGKSYALLLENCAAVCDRMRDAVSAAEYRAEASRVKEKFNQTEADPAGQSEE